MNDSISRQDAIDLLKKWSDGYSYIEVETNSAIKAFEEMPHAQPEVAKDTNVPNNDCISRQAAIDAICKACSLSGDYQKCDGYPEESTWCEELVALRALPSEQPQWIPCSERMPEEERYVLVTASNGAVTEAKFWHKEGIWVKGLSIVSVTAWMPLPEPYEGSDAK